MTQGITAPNRDTVSSRDTAPKRGNAPQIIKTGNFIIADDINDNENEATFEEIHPGISFSKRSEVIRIYRTTIEALSNPGRIAFLFNKEKKEIAVLPCRADFSGGIEVPKYVDEWDGFRISSLPFLNIVWHYAGWQGSETYRIIGEKIHGSRLVRFRLEDAEIVNEAQAEEGSMGVSPM